MWLERPCKLSEHCQATSYVPADLQKQLGKDTYALKVQGAPVPSPASFPDEATCSRPPRQAANLEVEEDDPFNEEHEYNASKSVAYRPGPDVPRGHKFKTHWEGFGWTHDSWEPASAFVPGCTHCFVDFLKRRKIDFELTDVCVPKKACCTSLRPREGPRNGYHVSYLGLVEFVTSGRAQSAWDCVHTGAQGAWSHLPQPPDEGIHGMQAVFSPCPAPPNSSTPE